MTSRQDWPKPDLLQQHRLELGLPADTAPISPLPSLLLKGGIGAVVLVMLSWLTVLGLQHRRQVLQAEVDALKPVEKSVGDAKARLDDEKSRKSTLEDQTQSIAEQLLAVRSGSALLEQFRQVTPQDLRLLAVEAKSSKLVFKGESRGKDPFERINALALNLEALLIMLPNGTSVVQADSLDQKEFYDHIDRKFSKEKLFKSNLEDHCKEAMLADLEYEGERICFTLDATFDPNIRFTPAYLRGLGAEGLARRLEVLQVSGVLK